MCYCVEATVVYKLEVSKTNYITAWENFTNFKSTLNKWKCMKRHLKGTFRQSSDDAATVASWSELKNTVSWKRSKEQSCRLFAEVSVVVRYIICWCGWPARTVTECLCKHLLSLFIYYDIILYLRQWAFSPDGWVNSTIYHQCMKHLICPAR